MLQGRWAWPMAGCESSTRCLLSLPFPRKGVRSLLKLARRLDPGVSGLFIFLVSFSDPWQDSELL